MDKAGAIITIFKKSLETCYKMSITKLGILNVCNKLRIIINVYISLLGFPGATVVNNLPANAGDTRDVDWIPLSGRTPWRRKWQHTPVI